jgi:hypothetical protein
MAEETVLGTDPRLARLRQHLVVARAAGLDFSEAWAGGRRMVLSGVSRRQRQEYQSALHVTREAWRRAYEGVRPRGLGGVRAGGLHSDGELDSLHPVV